MGVADQQTEGVDSLDRDRVHHILSNSRRRTVLRVLREAGEPLSVRELSERVATAETDEDPAPRDVRHTVYVSLQQNHLPQLTEHGVVEFDEDDKTVALGTAASAVATYGRSETHTTAHGVYALVAAGGLLGVAGSAAGVPGVASLPAAGYAAAALLAVLATAVTGLSAAR